jgi:hypothetical protein
MCVPGATRREGRAREAPGLEAPLRDRHRGGRGAKEGCPRRRPHGDAQAEPGRIRRPSWHPEAEGGLSDPADGIACDGQTPLRPCGRRAGQRSWRPVALAVALLLATCGPSAAGGAPPVQLLLPLLTTGSMLAYQLHRVRGVPSGIRGRSVMLSLLPSSLSVPDLYAVDLGEREPHLLAAPVDRTIYGSLNLLPARFAHGRSLSPPTPPRACRRSATRARSFDSRSRPSSERVLPARCAPDRGVTLSDAGAPQLQ